MQIPAVEDRILNGFQLQYQKQFGCDIVIAQTTDQIKQLQLRTDGGQPSYPFAYAKATTIASPETPDHYVPRYLLRKGINVQLSASQNTGYNIRLLPVIVTLDVTYETNATVGEGNSILWYIKRWLFACRMGLLSFKIDLGNYRLAICTTGDMSVNVPGDRASPSEDESGYKINTTASIKGYMSEIQAVPVGFLTTLNVSASYFDNQESTEVWNFTPES